MSLAGLSKEDAAAIALRSQTDSPLLRLPGELRNRIWEYAFGGMIIQVLIGRKLCLVYEKGTWARLPFHASALLKSTAACRQIHTETNILPLQRNDLYFPKMTVMIDTLSKISPKQRKHVKSIRLWVKDYQEHSSAQRPTAVMGHLDSLEVVVVDLPSIRDGPYESMIRRAVEAVLRATLGKVRVQFG